MFPSLIMVSERQQIHWRIVKKEDKSSSPSSMFLRAMRATRRSGRTPSIALLSKLTLGRNLRRWRGNWSDKSSSKYATLQASLPPLLTNWPMLRGLTGRFVSQLVSAILNKPTLRSTLVFSNYCIQISRLNGSK